jgi:hypothetical protein
MTRILSHLQIWSKLKNFDSPRFLECLIIWDGGSRYNACMFRKPLGLIWAVPKSKAQRFRHLSASHVGSLPFSSCSPVTWRPRYVPGREVVFTRSPPAIKHRPAARWAFVLFRSIHREWDRVLGGDDAVIREDSDGEDCHPRGRGLRHRRRRRSRTRKVRAHRTRNSLHAYLA